MPEDRRRKRTTIVPDGKDGEVGGKNVKLRGRETKNASVWRSLLMGKTVRSGGNAGRCFQRG